ncbi:hypothetical protein [Sulfuriroseicoccus oceanibius]|uniref:Uncharacterized protein n=1 Tax=Sulfuriroseicoccus oceanibius TaxID=2707525 RepID=A0A6B3LA33_9BACT|nr:hypothetical protein [Sulfuriroseicoccus oceanibius]QQL44221.1 hypothetical protein G3M56_009975 [Sulfuriroseicoccus oceanibius]
MSQQTDPNHEKLSALLKLKRYEQPDLGYFDRFADEFRATEDAKAYKPSLLEVWKRKVVQLVQRLEDRPRFVLGTAVAYGAIALAAVMTFQRGVSGDSVADGVHEDLLVTPVSLTAPKKVVVPVVESVSENERRKATQEAEEK